MIHNEIVKDSTRWGNYRNCRKPTDWKFTKTGQNKKWCTNAIYDFAGNVSEWTQEKCENDTRIVYAIRGGSCKDYGNVVPVSNRYYAINHDIFNIGFRAALYIR